MAEHQCVTEEANNNDLVSDFLMANFELANEFYPDLDRKKFYEHWRAEFEFLAAQGLNGQLQLNFPEISFNNLIEKYRDLTRRLKGTGENVEGIRNYFPEYFTPELMDAADPDAEDWVSLIVENPSAGVNDDPCLFGRGLPYDEQSAVKCNGITMQTEMGRLVDEMKSKAPGLEFSAGNVRTRIIQSSLFMIARLARKERRPASGRSRLKFWSTQLLMDGRLDSGWIPYLFMDGGGGSCLGKDGGSGNSVYGFSIQARKK